MRANRKSPVFLNLLHIKQPVTAIASVLHRITGLLLFLLLPAVVGVFELSLTSEEGFARAVGLLHSVPARLLGILALWWFAYHALAGLRIMLIEAGAGVDFAVARRSAWLVIALGLAILVFAGGWMA